MKQFFKLYKNHIVIAVSSISLVGVLGSCIGKRPESENNSVQIQVIRDNDITVNNQVNEVVDNSYSELSDSSSSKTSDVSADEYAIDYINSLSSDKNDSSRGGKIRKIVDFVFNGKELGGYTFDDLTDIGKKNVVSSLYSLDDVIEEYIPDYKERLKSWALEKGEKIEDLLVDGGVYLKEKWNNYKQKVNDNYERKVLPK